MMSKGQLEHRDEISREDLGKVTFALDLEQREEFL